MTKALPRKLQKEPLLDAIFEVRFASTAPASIIVPGALYSRLEGNKATTQLPIAQVVKPIRDADPNLRYQPLARLDWDQYFINISDYSLSVSCKYPYPGWASFKPAIVKVINLLSDCKIVTSVERYSLKYIDLFPSSDNRQKVSMINLDVMIAGHKLEREPFTIRVDVPGGGAITAIQVVSSAKATLHTGAVREGLVVDIDSVVNQNNVPITQLLDGFSEKLDAIHQTNKAIFFDCITDATVASLEPIYE